MRSLQSAIVALALGCGDQTTALDPTSPRPVTVQPDATMGTDVWITSVFSYSDDYGVDDEKLEVGGWADWYHSLIRFDLAGLPSVAASATVVLQPFPRGDASTPVPMELHRVMSGWNEATGWFTRPPSMLLAGLATPVANVPYSIDVTALYNDWKSGTVPNYGIELRPTANDNRFNVFRSSDYRANASHRPRLTVIPSTSASADRFTWPTDPSNTSRGSYAPCGDNPLCFWLDRPDGWRDVQPFLKYPLPGTGRYHLGADWNRGSGSNDARLLVYAIGDGQVVDAIPSVPGFGNVVFIQHKTSFGEYVSMYAHLEWLTSGAPPRGRVSRGDPIARVGNTVGSGTPVPYHLHLEIRAGTNRTIGTGYASDQSALTPQGQVDPNLFIGSHR